MKTFSKTRQFLAAAFAAIVLASGFLAVTSPASASGYCQYNCGSYDGGSNYGSHGSSYGGSYSSGY